MARFRAWIEGRAKRPQYVDSDTTRTSARLGDDTVLAEVTGAQVGVFAEARVDPNDEDVIDLYATRGRARDAEPPVLLGHVRVVRGEPRFTAEPEALLAAEDRA